MTYASILWIVIGVGLVVWIGIRQLTWQVLSERSIWVMPLVLMGVGVVSGTSQLKDVRVDAAGVGLLVVELVLSVGLGALMGRIGQFRRLPDGTIDRRGRPVRWETRAGWTGLALWAGLVAVRVGTDVWAQAAHVGGGLLTSSAVIIVIVGLNRLARSAVLQQRLGRSALAPAA